MKVLLTLAAAAALSAGGIAVAQSPDYMMEDCRNNSQIFYQAFDKFSETKYEGQRTDGTHAVNGTIYLANGNQTFQCSYNRAGDRMVDFYADGKSWPGFVRGEGSPYMAKSSGYPIFAAECAGGVNRGGYNIDTDDKGHLWVNGHRVNLHTLSTQAWEGGYHGVTFDISRDGSNLIVTYTGHGGANGVCTIVSQ